MGFEIRKRKACEDKGVYKNKEAIKYKIGDKMFYKKM